jgi:saccharopine dehydrogenase-like NADP-dependent oxidoreductase
MSNVVILGAGKIGKAMARMLLQSGDYTVSLCDSDPRYFGALTQDILRIVLDVKDEVALKEALSGADYVVSALPFFLNPGVAKAAAATKTHYFDLTEDVKTARAVYDISLNSDRLFMPQCGLAPGFISIVAHSLVNRFEESLDVHLRVGALPQFPENALKYNLTWSTDGLINEYCNPCESIVEGEMQDVLPLEGLEHFSLDGVDYEAFNTSGGIGSLCETLGGQVRNLNYKTVRYPGHRDMMQMLCQDLRLCERRDVFREIVEGGIAITHQDVVLIFVSVKGKRHGMLEQESFVKKIYADRDMDGYSAIQKTTSAGLCALLDLHRDGKLLQGGYVKPEIVKLEDFLENRFGSIYA